MIVGSGYLFWLYLSAPVEPRSRVLRYASEVISWYLVVDFLVFVSTVNLQTGFERIGSTSIIVLLSWLICLPVIWKRDTALEQRLARIPSGISMSLSLIVLMATLVVTVAYLVTPQKFIN